METKYSRSHVTLRGRFGLLLALGLFLAGAPKTSSAITTPARNAGTAANVTGVGTVAWTNAGNVAADDNVYATIAINNATSNYLQATNYGFSIPPEATINGIAVTIGRFQNATASGNDVRDNVVQLIKGGTIVGSNKAATGTEWPTSEGIASYGNSSDLWGTTVTPADINASNFGVALAVYTTNSRTASVDYIQISVTYTGTYLSQFTAMNTGSSTWCAGETRTVTVTIKNNGTVTWTDSWPDINIGVKWNADADYNIRTDAGGLAPGATRTYPLTVTAPSTGSNNLTFDLVYEALSWFAGNGGGVGPGNVVFTSPAINIGASVPAQPSAITGSTIPCAGSSQTYSVTNISGITYLWALPTDWVKTGGGTTNSITVTIGSVSGDVQVTPSNVSCSGPMRVLTTAVSKPVTTITDQTNISCNGRSDGSLTISASGGIAPYTFSINNGTTYPGNGNSTHQFQNLPAGNNYRIRVKDNNGCESVSIP